MVLWFDGSIGCADSPPLFHKLDLHGCHVLGRYFVSNTRCRAKLLERGWTHSRPYTTNVRLFPRRWKQLVFPEIALRKPRNYRRCFRASFFRGNFTRRRIPSEIPVKSVRPFIPRISTSTLEKEGRKKNLGKNGNGVLWKFLKAPRRLLSIIVWHVTKRCIRMRNVREYICDCRTRLYRALFTNRIHARPMKLHSTTDKINSQS